MEEAEHVEQDGRITKGAGFSVRIVSRVSKESSTKMEGRREKGKRETLSVVIRDTKHPVPRRSIRRVKRC